MIIESTEDLEVVKSFDELGLREELLRGKLFLAYSNFYNRYICIWIQQAISSTTKSNIANNEGQRRNSIKSSWYW